MLFVFSTTQIFHPYQLPNKYLWRFLGLVLDFVSGPDWGMTCEFNPVRTQRVRLLNPKYGASQAGCLLSGEWKWILLL